MVSAPDPQTVTLREQTQLSHDLRQPTLVSFLDLARWLAAAVVFVSHLRGPLFLGYGDVAAQVGFAVKIWYFVTGFHAEAVIVFFVLSGFLVGGIGLDRLSSQGFDRRSYAAARLSRLFLPFVPAVFLTLLLDSIGAFGFSASGFWDHTHPMLAEKIASSPFGTLLDPGTVVGNVLMLQTIVVEPLGSNQPLWTISLEFWFYVVFGLFAAALARTGNARPILLSAAVAASLLLGPTFLVYFALWCIGAGLAALPRRARLPWPFALVIFILLLAVARFYQAYTDGDETLRILKNTVIALSFAVLLVSMRGRSLRLLEWMQPLNRWFADFSYSLYLIHYPVMIFLLAILSEFFGLTGIRDGYHPNDIEGLTIYFGVILAVYLFAWAFSLLTERHTERARRFLRSRLKRLGRNTEPGMERGS